MKINFKDALIILSSNDWTVEYGVKNMIIYDQLVNTWILVVEIRERLLGHDVINKLIIF